jgi:hypothetical protein
VYFALTFHDRFDTPLVRVDTVRMYQSLSLKEGLNRFVVRIESLHLNPGDYRLALWLADTEQVLDQIPVATTVTVSEYSASPEPRKPGIEGVVTSRFTVEPA